MPDQRSKAPWAVLGVLVLALVIAGGVWANQLNLPVTVEGTPSYDPWGKLIPTYTPTPSATPTLTASPTPSKSPSPTPSKSKTPSPTPTKTEPPKPTYSYSNIEIGSASGIGKEYRFIIQTEDSLGVDPNEIAQIVADVLNDPRSWAGNGKVQFVLVADAKQADFAVKVLARTTPVEVTKKAIKFSATLWATKPASFADFESYRAYLVNHYVGQVIGKKVKTQCTANAEAAPIMLDQLNNLGACLTNPWVS
ncbi:MAG: DUF3152 domain-containing protein [Propionibacteriaceae bacterium]|jgi:hypothetical protein|nr:DUF3152 domain-containing protein [Propionibacteriaceae bacterium]